MPNQTWPAELSEAFTSDAFTETSQAVVIRTDMDTGPPKMRRRFINPVRTYRCEIVLRDAAQYLALHNFYYITLQATDTILMPHPITGAPTSFRFVGAPAFAALGIAWRAAFELEALP